MELSGNYQGTRHLIGYHKRVSSQEAGFCEAKAMRTTGCRGMGWYEPRGQDTECVGKGGWGAYDAWELGRGGGSGPGCIRAAKRRPRVLRRSSGKPNSSITAW